MSSIDDKYDDAARDYGRKLYRGSDDDGFRDLMRKKTVFMYDESFKASWSALEKPYLEDDYHEMETFLWNPPGFPPAIFDPPSSWDFPSVPSDPQDPGEPFGWPSLTVFYCTASGCYCENDTRSAIVECSHEITAVSLSFARLASKDFSVAVQLMGTAARLSITAGEDPPGALEIDVSMRAGAVKGSHDSIMITECYDCTPCEEADDISWDTQNTAGTINAGENLPVYILDGVGPFTWEIDQCGDSGSGCSLSAAVTSGRSNVLYTTEDACGTIFITVTDSCEDEATGAIAVADNGEWHSVDSRVLLNAGGCQCSCGRVYTGYQNDTCAATYFRQPYPCLYLSDVMRVASVCGALCCGEGCAPPTCTVGPGTGYGHSFPCWQPCVGDICVQDRIYAEVYGCPI
jgi:hypothetical protein